MFEKILRASSITCWLIVLFLCSPGSSASWAQGLKNQPAFPSPATPKLAAKFQVTVSGQSIRDLARSIQAATKLPVLLDRRIDPGSQVIPKIHAEQSDPQAAPIMRPKILGPTLHQTLDGLIEARNEPAPNGGFPAAREEWVSAGEIAIVGPAGQAIPAATEILAARGKLQASLNRFPPREVRWPELTTPENALKIVADTWNIDVEQIDLPHDLWPETDLGTVHITTALGVIASQFGQHFELDPSSATITARPLRPNAVARIKYPLMELTVAEREHLTRVGAKLRKQTDCWELTGDASAHFQMELAIFKRGSTGRSGRPSTRAITKYTFTFIGTVSDALTNLCQAGNLELDAESLSEPSKRQRIELEVKDKSIEEILREVAKQANLKITFNGDQVSVSSEN